MWNWAYPSVSDLPTNHCANVWSLVLNLQLCGSMTALPPCMVGVAPAQLCPWGFYSTYQSGFSSPCTFCFQVYDLAGKLPILFPTVFPSRFITAAQLNVSHTLDGWISHFFFRLFSVAALMATPPHGSHYRLPEWMESSWWLHFRVTHASPPFGSWSGM